MTDDFPADDSTTGRYSVFDAPLVISSDSNSFEVDHDWIRVSGLRKFTDYNFLVYRNEDEPTPRFGDLTIYDTASQRVESFRPKYGDNTYHHTADDGDFFVDLQSFRFDEEATSFNFYIRPVDVAGDTLTEAVPLIPNLDRGFGARIDSDSDVDWYSFDLIGGVTYTINVLGDSSNSTLGTTLGDPLLELFTQSGEFVGNDNNSGEGTNSRLVYTPTDTGKFGLRVTGNGTRGTYFLQSDQFDDHFDDPENAISFSVGTPVTAITNFAGDRDLLSVNLTADVDYQLNGSRRALALVDNEGNFLSSFEEIYSPLVSGDHFVRIGFGTAGDENEIGIEQVDLIGETTETSRVVNEVVENSVIDFTEDRDRFTYGMFQHGLYYFEVKGEGDLPAGQPGLAFRLDDGEFISYEADGELLYQADFGPDEFGNSRRLGLLDIRSHDGSTGTYALRARPIDRTPGNTTTAWTVGLTDGRGEIRDVIEHAGDVDYYRINLKADTWYQFSTPDGFGVRLDLEDSNGDVDSIFSSNGLPSTFYTDAGGTYYIINNGEFHARGSFELDVVEDAKPEGPGGEFTWGPANLFERIDRQRRHFAGFQGEVEVVSDTLITYIEGGSGGTRIELPAGELRRISASEWTTILPGPGVGAVGELFVRGIPDSDDPNTTHSWGNIALGRRPLADQIAAPTTRYIGYYEFAQELPEYLVDDSRFSGFTPLNATEEETLSDVAVDWNFKSKTFGVFSAEDFDRSADVQIFKAALGTDDDVLAFANGEGIGGDIIINTNSAIMQDLTPGGQGFFELLRAVGTVFGLQETEAYDLTQSVMGDRGTAINGVFPSTIMPLDAIATRRSDDFSSHFAGNPNEDSFSLVSDTPFIRMVASGFDDTHIRTITAEGSSLNSRLDLRPGMQSFSAVGDETPFLFVNSHFSGLLDGIGGEGNDGLIGNQLDNTLRGNGGDDVLRGGNGDDLLLGGSGNDFYQFRPGYGHDVIDEEGAGGTDILRVEGLPIVDGLYQNLTFEKLGDDLVVRLELDLQPNRTADSITIRNMANADSRIETLTLLNGTGQATAWIDLASVYDQLEDPRQRFGITLDTTEFGHLTVPIG